MVTRPREFVDRVESVASHLQRRIREGVLRADLRGDTMFMMFAAILERALFLTIGDQMTPEEATEAALAIFVDGARNPVPTRQAG